MDDFLITGISDLLITGISNIIYDQMEKQIQTKFTLYDLGVVNFFLYIEVHHTSDGVHLSQ